VVINYLREKPYPTAWYIFFIIRRMRRYKIACTVVQPRMKATWELLLTSLIIMLHSSRISWLWEIRREAYYRKFGFILNKNTIREWSNENKVSAIVNVNAPSKMLIFIRSMVETVQSFKNNTALPNDVKGLVAT